MRDFQSYREGFIAGIDLKENHKCQIMGYDLFEILAIIQQQEENKMIEMTVAEALEKTAHCKTLIESLEALGLIKLKEVEKEPDLIEEIYSGIVSLTPTGLRAKLEANSYKIVRDT